MNLSQIFFLLRRKKLNSFSDMTQRIELFSNVTQELNLFFLIDSENWTFSNMTQRIEPFSDVTQRIEPFFSNMTQRIEPFVLISKNWIFHLTQILTKKSQRSEPFWIWFKELNFVFKKKTQRIDLFFSWKNSKIKNKIIELLNMTLRIEPSLFNMTLRIEPFFLIWLKQLNFFKTWIQRIEPFFFFSKFFFLKKVKDLNLLFQIWLEDFFFLKKYSKNLPFLWRLKDFLKNKLTLGIDFFISLKELNSVCSVCLFLVWFKELIFSALLKDLNSFQYDSKNWIIFSMTQSIEPSSFQYDEKNWTFFLWIWRNPFSWIWRKEFSNHFLFPIWLKEGNLF